MLNSIYTYIYKYFINHTGFLTDIVLNYASNKIAKIKVA